MMELTKATLFNWEMTFGTHVLAEAVARRLRRMTDGHGGVLFPKVRRTGAVVTLYGAARRPWAILGAVPTDGPRCIGLY